MIGINQLRWPATHSSVAQPHCETNMRVTVLLAILIAGCTSAPHGGDPYECPVWEVTSDVTDGRVNVNPSLVAILDAQVPEAKLSSAHVCWYQTPEGHLEGYPWHYGYDTGFEFEKATSGWRYLKRNDYIVLSHRRRR